MHELEEDVSGHFPPEYTSPKEKEKPAYGLQYARAMYSATNRMGPRFYYDNSEYQSLIEAAQGRESVDRISNLFGYFNNGYQDDDADQLAYIDIQNLNLAPKYINRAVAKMQKYSYELSVDAVDPVAIEEKEAYASALQSFYQCNQWLMEMGINAQELYPELDISILPKFMDEMMFDATVNPKIKKEIWAENALKLLQYVNEFQQKMREVDWDIVVLGKGHLHFYEDENGVPRCERVPSEHYIGSYVDNENYTDQEYAGFFDWISVNQLRKEMLACGKSEEEIKSISDRWSYESTPPYTNMYGNFNQYDGLTYIPVLRFYFRSEDNRSHVISKNEKYGFDQHFEKSFNYKPEENVQQYFKKGERKLNQIAYTSIYGGTWVLDTDVVYNYGRKKLPRTELVNARLPIVTFAPNMKQGRVVSFFSQMIEPLFMINVTHNKIKEILAKGWMGLREIDFTQLEGVALGKGGQVWTPRQVYEFILKTNVVPKRTQLTQWKQAVSNQTVQDVQSGLNLADYFTSLEKYIAILENMTSTSVADGLTVPDRLSATVAKQSAQTSDVDMEYLYNAHEEMFKQGSHMFLLLLQEMKRDGRKFEAFHRSLGKSAKKFFDDEVPYCEYGLTITRKPTEEMWAQFYSDVAIALQNQEISLADSVFLREIDNLKQARQMMVVRAKQYKREKQDEAQFNNNLAIQSNQAAAQSKMEGEVMKEREKFRLASELEVLKGKITGMLNQADRRWEADLEMIANQSKERVKREEVNGSIIKESMRKKALEYQSNNRLQETIISEANKSYVEQKKLAAPKPKSTAK
jgi:hypothetical protein